MPFQSNPADLISRGIEPTILSTSTLWWKEPPRTKTITKGYIAIFVSFVNKAVHFGVVTSFSTEAFLAAQRRFISRGGKPRTICSHNGTNFPGVANELRAIYKTLHKWQQY